MSSSKRYVFLAVFPLAWAVLVFLWPAWGLVSPNEFYSVVGWTYSCMLFYLSAHWLIGRGIEKFGENEALIGLMTVVLGLIFYWQLGGRERLDWLLPGITGSSARIGPFFLLVPLFTRFVVKNGSAKQKPAPSASNDPNVQLPPTR